MLKLYCFWNGYFRLKESKSRNQKISDELRSLKSEHTALQQRVEEDQVADDKSPDAPKFKRQDSDRIHARQIMQMKDHLVELERTVCLGAAWS